MKKFNSKSKIQNPPLPSKLYSLFFAAWIVLSASSPARAEQPAALSLQGYSGILNTPTGHVQSEGSFAALYSNQREHIRRKAQPPWQDNYLFSVGMFNFAEIGGRLSEAPRTTRDLSANVKISTAPFTAGLPFAPALAVGRQDLGGTGTFRTTYLAASADPLPWLRLSAGYGNGPARMKGAFGGAEVKAHDWVTLLGEYDTHDTNAGLRLTAPPLPRFPASLTITAKTALNRSAGVEIAFGLNMPLDTKQVPVRSEEKKQVRGEGSGVRGEGSGESTIQNPTSKIQNSSVNALRARLIAAGFANVQVGTLNDTTLVVEYENVRYNHNELDALGVVAGIAATGDVEGIDSLWLVVKRKGLRMIRVGAALRDLKLWLEGTGSVSAPTLVVTTDTSDIASVRFTPGDSNPDWLKPSLILYPGLKTYVGTEVGVFDVLLSIKPDLQVSLWKGGVLNARWDLPVTWSKNFNDGKPFASDRKDPQLDRLMLFQGISLAPGLIASLGAGTIVHDTAGMLNELVWSPGEGMHRFRLTQAYARNSNTHRDNRVWLGAYRLYLSSLDLHLEGTAGRFWGEDNGALVTLKRFFGDTAVDLYYKNTVTLEKKRWQAAGIQFSFPLTPRRDMKRDLIQARGADEWGYAQETVLTTSKQKTNDTVSAALAVNPLPSAAIYRSYLNRDRLNGEYIRSHRERMREAWRTFREDLNGNVTF